jgi:hypothetical protein
MAESGSGVLTGWGMLRTVLSNSTARVMGIMGVNGTGWTTSGMDLVGQVLTRMASIPPHHLPRRGEGKEKDGGCMGCRGFYGSGRDWSHSSMSIKSILGPKSPVYNDTAMTLVMVSFS